MSRTAGAISVSNREKVKTAAILRRDGASYRQIAKEVGSDERTVRRWAAAGLFEAQQPHTPREVLEVLLTDPSPTTRLQAAKVLYALEEAPQDDATPEFERVIYAAPNVEPPEGCERPCAVLTIYR